MNIDDVLKKIIILPYQFPYRLIAADESSKAF